MQRSQRLSFLFFFNDTATTEIYTLSLHDALPIYLARDVARFAEPANDHLSRAIQDEPDRLLDRKSTRLNSSHSQISYAVFCLKKKNRPPLLYLTNTTHEALSPMKPTRDSTLVPCS